MVARILSLRARPVVTARPRLHRLSRTRTRCLFSISLEVFTRSLRTPRGREISRLSKPRPLRLPLVVFSPFSLSLSPSASVSQVVSVGASTSSSWPTDGRTDNERNDMVYDDKKKESRQKATFFDEKIKSSSSFVFVIFFSLSRERGEGSPLFAPHTSSITWGGVVTRRKKKTKTKTKTDVTFSSSSSFSSCAARRIEEKKRGW